MNWRDLLPLERREEDEHHKRLALEKKVGDYKKETCKLKNELAKRHQCSCIDQLVALRKKLEDERIYHSNMEDFEKWWECRVSCYPITQKVDGCCKRTAELEETLRNERKAAEEDQHQLKQQLNTLDDTTKKLDLQIAEHQARQDICSLFIHFLKFILFIYLYY